MSPTAFVYFPSLVFCDLRSSFLPSKMFSGKANQGEFCDHADLTYMRKKPSPPSPRPFAGKL